jgi:hypothetical protein
MEQSKKSPLGKLKKSNGKAITEFFSEHNNLAIPNKIRDKIEKAGYDARWIDSKKLVDLGGYHEKGWQPYEATKDDANIFGETPDFVGGLVDNRVRRGTMILAVRPIQLSAMYKQKVKERTQRQTTSIRNSADELAQQAAREGIGRISNETTVTQVPVSED